MTLPGARYTPATYSGSGSARVSSLPLTVTGSSGSAMTAAGTMQPGNCCARVARTSAGFTAPTT
ncbi:Uncharacterised protein [Mycobacteroides abscessus subsp. abscessus]|nr:Uncharacterised protein [Mycobacteroides abscessus subsp. abscessus]